MKTRRSLCPVSTSFQFVLGGLMISELSLNPQGGEQGSANHGTWQPRSACLGSTTTRDHAPARLTVGACVAFPSGKSVGIPIYGFRSSIPCPLMPLSTLRRQPRDCLRKTQSQADRYPFPVRLFHSLLHAGLSRRTTWHGFPSSPFPLPTRLTGPAGVERFRPRPVKVPVCGSCSNLS